MVSTDRSMYGTVCHPVVFRLNSSLHRPCSESFFFVFHLSMQLWLDGSRRKHQPRELLANLCSFETSSDRSVVLYSHLYYYSVSSIVLWLCFLFLFAFFKLFPMHCVSFFLEIPQLCSFIWPTTMPSRSAHSIGCLLQTIGFRDIH